MNIAETTNIDSVTPTELKRMERELNQKEKEEAKKLKMEAAQKKKEELA